MSQHSDQAVAASDPKNPAAPVPDRGAVTTGGILTVAGVLVLFVILAFGISFLQYCLDYLDRGSRGETAPRPSGRRRRRRAAAVGIGTIRGGVDPDLLRSLPVTVYRAAAAKDGKTDYSSVECAVCLAELEDGEEARFLPRCGHGFHAECVDMWLASHTTCPLCRLTVAKPDMPMMHAPALPLHLPPVPREVANYSTYASSILPASVLLGVSDRHRSAVDETAPSTTNSVTTATMVIAIPESAAPTTCEAAEKSPGSTSARMRAIRMLWSFGRQGPGSSSSSGSCAGGGSERTDVEQGIGNVFTEAQLHSEAAAGATRGAGL